MKEKPVTISHIPRSCRTSRTTATVPNFISKNKKEPKKERKDNKTKQTNKANVQDRKEKICLKSPSSFLLSGPCRQAQLILPHNPAATNFLGQPPFKGCTKMIERAIHRYIPRTTISSLNWQSLQSSPNSIVPTWSPDALRQRTNKTTLVNHDIIALSEDSYPLAMFFKQGLRRVWQDKCADLVQHCQNAIDTLNLTYPPPRIKISDKRHTNVLQYEEKKIPYGVYHLGIWVEQGQSDNVPILSSETRKLTNIQHQAVLNYFRRIAPLVHAIGLFFERVDPQAFRVYQSAYEQVLNLTSLSAYHYSGKAAFLAHALLRNLTVEPHKDRGDVKEGWVAMCCFGEFTGGEFVVPALNIRFCFKPGDILFLRSAVLEHYVTAIDGSRSSMVFFTKKQLHGRDIDERISQY